eukprot:6210894-Pleurochrysis_carterae.AAC.3
MLAGLDALSAYDYLWGSMYTRRFRLALLQRAQALTEYVHARLLHHHVHLQACITLVHHSLRTVADEMRRRGLAGVLVRASRRSCMHPCAALVSMREHTGESVAAA